ncbi:hypothetical protein GCM10007874_00180 [Labrys miyagiensis]|uniref:Uncharacterized protein n=1 Tax=Labrys miyagiensis TaxID=346912 RepID=A0ABQ6CBI6_9HYPH|nr:hypothetical protein GCM10007874_00180 [Labrys miyagiensis]
MRCLDQQIIDILSKDHPQSLRHAYYCLTNPPSRIGLEGYGWVPRGEAMLARIAPRWAQPVRLDNTCDARGYFVSTFDNPAGFLRAQSGLYGADLWKQAGILAELWCKSRSIPGAIVGDGQELAVSLWHAGGFKNWSLAFQAACARNGRDDGRPGIIIGKFQLKTVRASGGTSPQPNA